VRQLLVSKIPASAVTSGKTLALNSRSDTIDILKYTINLNVTDFTTDTIRGNTLVQFVPKLNGIKTLSLDLLELKVDSIKSSNHKLAYSYDDTLIVTTLPSTLNAGDTSTVTVYYHGKPQIDNGGWGGFYFNSGYAFNLGIGIQAEPHNYGRAWFPCFDNFVERSKYEFNITTDSINTTFCDGAMTKDSVANGLRTRQWIMNDEMPTYLAGIAIANYAPVYQTYSGINRNIPVILVSQAADTANMKLSFKNLDAALSSFENHYGEYPWNRVGYCMVPFGSGAMEHTTNIAYPLLAANGTTTYEAEFMAHELAHQWFGDLITCETEGDIWMKEGPATYSQSLFTESVYGENAYLNSIEANREYVLQYAHVVDAGYRAISGMIHQYSYGAHVYFKGCDVMYILRSYLGDSLYFSGLKFLLSNNKFQSIDAYKMRDDMKSSTNYDLTDFFNDWVFNPGYPQFSVDSFKVSGNYNVTVYIKQRLHGGNHFFNHVPIEISFKDANWNETVKTVSVSGQSSSFTFTLPTKPVYVGLNRSGKMGTAISSDEKVIKATGNYFSFTLGGRMIVKVASVKDSAFIRVEHNYAPPDLFKKQLPYRLSDYHYWKVDGINLSNLKASSVIYYDGRTSATSGGGCWLDNTLINESEDSLFLFYRKNAASDWSIFPYYVKNTLSNLNDKYGSITIDSLFAGEYAFGMKDYKANIPDLVDNKLSLAIYPNPATNEFMVNVTDNNIGKDYLINVIDINGKIVYSHQESNRSMFNIRTSNWANGVYFISVKDNQDFVGRGKIVVIN